MADQTVSFQPTQTAGADAGVATQPLEWAGHSCGVSKSLDTALTIRMGAPTGLCDRNGAELLEGCLVRHVPTKLPMMIVFHPDIGFAARCSRHPESFYPLTHMKRVGTGAKRRWIERLERMGT